MSIKPSKGLPLIDGRQQTDKSLKSERAKIDESLSKSLKSKQRVTDAVVSSDRADADEARLKSRNHTDEIKPKKTSDFVKPASSQSDAKSGLIQERQTADEALENERQLMDTALENERNQNEAIETSHFSTERSRTDKDLTRERIQTDEHFQCAVNDLSEEKSAHAETLVALTTRDEFLAIVSHDLRNPLGTISMAAEVLIAHRLYASADQEIRQYIEMMHRSAAEGLRLIGDLMDMESIAAGKLYLQMGSHNVSEIIRHSVNAFHLSATSKGLSLEIETSNPEVPALCDPARITQVLSNLIGNAIKFTPAGGTIVLAAVPLQNDTQVSVTDSGPGIPENMMKTIFERFWQIGKHDRRGLGLGLYISRMIVEAHKGRLWVDSELGKGSSFRFTIPTRSH